MIARNAVALAAVALLVGSRGPALAAPTLGGYVQVWWTAHEAFESGLRQVGTSDLAAQSTSGFSLRRARLAVEDSLGTARVRFRVEALLERSARLTDCYLAARVADSVEARIGQMKIPSTYEAMTSTSRTDFVQPTPVSRLLPDWSLSRTPYISTFMGNRAYLRDAGVGLAVGAGRWRAYAMVGNGLGANLFIGGRQNEEYIQTNSPGDWMYGLRLDAEPTPWLELGGHGLVNRHDDMMFNDDRTVYDLHRRSWSADALVRLPHRLRLRGLLAGGVVDDDYYRDGRRNYEYRGYELKAMHCLRPDRLELGLRLDGYDCEVSQAGGRIAQTDWTAGANWYWRGDSKVQLNYTWVDTDEPYLPDLDDDALLVNVQFAF